MNHAALTAFVLAAAGAGSSPVKFSSSSISLLAAASDVRALAWPTAPASRMRPFRGMNTADAVTRLFQDADSFDDRISSLDDITRTEAGLPAATATLRARLCDLARSDSPAVAGKFGRGRAERQRPALIEAEACERAQHLGQALDVEVVDLQRLLQ